MKSGIKKWEFRQSVSSVSVKRITSGSMVQDHADHVLKFIMTEAKNTAAAVRTVPWAVNVTDIWKSGTMYLHSLKVTEREIIPN